MRTHPRLSCSLLAAALLGLGTASAVDLEGLVKNSPFGGTGVAAGPGVAPSTLEFRGMYAEGGVSYYSIYNTLTKQSSWVAEGEAPSTNVPVVVKGFDIANETLVIDNGGQPQQMALHQAVVIAYRGPSAAQLAAVSNAVAPQGAVAGGTGAPGAGGPGNLTPEQVEAFRQSMREKFSKGGPPGSNGGDPRQRGNDSSSSGKSQKSSQDAASSNKSSKTPKVR
jgi:hypothetical protein